MSEDRNARHDKRQARAALLRHGTMDHYADAELYDFEYRDRVDDILWYRSFARRALTTTTSASPGSLDRSSARRRVLELGAGTGRVTLPLLADGHAVTALDRLRSMLDTLEHKHARALAAATAEGARLGPLEVVLGDMRALPFDDASFELVLAPFNTLQHLYEAQDLLACAREVRRVLKPGGRFAFDVMLPDLDWLLWDADRRHGVTEFIHPRTAQRMIYSTNHVYDHHTQVCHIRIYYDMAPPPGVEFTPPATPLSTVHLAHRQIFPEELRALISTAGLVLERLDGDFRGRRLGPDVESMLAICARPID